jgi:pimeloyl-ACP methyl ester carboxylesterase
LIGYRVSRRLRTGPYPNINGIEELKNNSLKQSSLVGAPMKRLIVLVPGITQNTGNWKPLKERLERETDLRGSTWLDFDRRRRVWPWSFKSPKRYAIDLRARIDNVWRTKGPFDEVLLVGHSFGGLLVRQAFLLGSGLLEEYNHKDEWCRHVKRFILFAAINRGFNPQNLNIVRFLYVALGWLMPLARRLEVGSDFITDLRLQWIRHFRELGARAPETVQLLGTRDGLVTRADSIDVTQFPNAEEIEIPGANHADIYRLDKAADEETRFKLIRDAFLKPIRAHAASATKAKKVRYVIFILHGIRANNSQWVEHARACIEARYLDVDVVPASYGYLPALDFVFPYLRRRNITWFKDKYSYYYAMYPDADFRFLGHSNGTYLLGRSLERVPGMRFTRVLLVGSVLPRKYNWAKIFDRNQITLLRNDRANRDVPVAILCSALSGLGMKDIGTAGFHGFNFNDQRTTEVFYYDGGHSEALSQTNIEKDLVGYLMKDETQSLTEEEKNILTTTHSKLRNNIPNKTFSYLSRIAPLVVSIFIVLIGFAAYTYWPSLASAKELLSNTTWAVIVGAMLLIGLVRAI